MIRTRFAPSPTGNVHIGNIRVAIFNWLYAKSVGGEFVIRVEDTDLQRSTPEAIEKMFDALRWLGLDYDGEPFYQTAAADTHKAAAVKLLESNFACTAGEGEPVYLRICKELFDPSFITEPRDSAEIKWKGGELVADNETIVHTVTSPNSGETYKTPVNWDTLTDSVLLLEDGTEVAGEQVRSKLKNEPVVLAEVAGGKVVAVRFMRRYVYFDDLVLGRCEKPVDSLRNLVIVRSDGSPVFHIANVIDDASQEVTHILRGNDHVENTYRHLFIFKALGLTPPAYGHFPMIVNAKGKPYSKRDGDAYVGDFKEKGFLPQALFNFLALCGWSPGDDREIMSKEEMAEAFSLDKVNSSAAQFDLKKLAWMNQQYLQSIDFTEFVALLRQEAEKAGLDIASRGDEWFEKLAGTQRERIAQMADFITNTSYFFSADYEYVPKAVKKNLLKNDGAGLATLQELAGFIAEMTEWNDEAIEASLQKFAESRDLMMGMVAQPLRVACTGATVSPGIGETLYLIGKDEVLRRIERTLAEIQPES